MLRHVDATGSNFHPTGHADRKVGSNTGKERDAHLLRSFLESGSFNPNLHNNCIYALKSAVLTRDDHILLMSISHTAFV